MIGTARYRKPAELARLGARHAVVEASAGTGKTYVLEHLVVDLLLTRAATINQILVVTFTEKATAELIARVRGKIEALKDLRPNHPDARAAEGLPDEECSIIDEAARRRLRDALFAFDRASISTIHAFCQGLLRDNAFLNGRLFDEEAVDEEEAFHQAFAEALRHDIAPDPALQPYLSAWLRDHNLADLERILLRAERGLACLYPRRPEALRPSALDEAAIVAAAAAFAATRLDAEKLRSALTAAGVHHATARSVAGKVDSLRGLAAECRAPADVPRLLASFNLFQKEEKERGLAYVRDNLALAAADRQVAPIAAAFAALDGVAIALSGACVQLLLPRVSARLTERKRREGRFDFQDMLTLVAQSLEGDGPRQRALLASVRARYRYALIDEFQDTDEVQWDIFRRIFFASDEGHVLTVIGDPKQAIYSFRGADVHTYLRAREAIAGQGSAPLHLTANFRSTGALIAAYNAILDQNAPFFRREGGILYDHPVVCGKPELALCDGAGRPAAPVVVLDIEARAPDLLTWQIKRALQARMVTELRALLDGGYRLAPHGRTLHPGDVFVLTRTLRESQEVGDVLRAAGIPFAFYKQEKLFTTVEASEVLDLLRAIADPEDRSARARAFITPFFGLALPDLAACDDLGAGDPLLRLLYEWKALADRGDFEALFARIVEQSGVICRELFFRGSERTLTNYLHVLEILQEHATAARATVRELAETLGAYVQGTRKPPGRDRDVQRLETDAKAVQIMTIHHAKGLEAAVVFVYGGFWTGPHNQVRVLHDEAGQRVVRVGRQPDPEELRYEAEQDDEERRVLYVALTRAKGRLYLPRYPESFKYLRGAYRFVNARLKDLLGGFTPPETRALFAQVTVPCPGEAPPALVEPTAAVLATWRPPAALLAPEPVDPERAAIAEERAGFALTSYSAVKRAHGGFVPAPAELEDPAAEERSPVEEPLAPLDPEELPRGRLSGSFLHEVIEELPLEPLARRPSLAAWSAEPAVAALFERMRRRHDRSPAHLPHARRLVHTALTADVRLGAVVLPGLASVARGSRELEFVYPIPESSHPLLGAPAPGADPVPFRIGRGVVRGYIDYLFEHEGLLYVCDWKGDWLPDWDEARVAEHCERNYAIQAQLYSLAALRLLGVDTPEAYERRFGGVLYCFLRGMRPDAPDAGVLFRRPPWAEILTWQREMLGDTFWGLR